MNGQNSNLVLLTRWTLIWRMLNQLPCCDTRLTGDIQPFNPPGAICVTVYGKCDGSADLGADCKHDARRQALCLAKVGIRAGALRAEYPSVSLAI